MLKTTIIGIAGGTASGKTTVASRLYEETKKYGSVNVIRIDDYYKDQSNLSLEERRKTNFDHPSAYDKDLLVKHLNDLKKGISINKPTYDFTISTRSDIVEKIEPCNVIIVEGIMAFAIPELRDMYDIKIFVDTPDDIRFIRRLSRDIEKRGRTVDNVINQYLSTVRPMHLSFVEPSKVYADLIVPIGGENNIAIDIITTKIVDLLKKSI
ncbi:MAG: uridine kinase [Coprobacillus sp.]|nr:uridine kinase [Coprobacillus sp.]MDY4144881.1 uridine kinase [Bacilli bacterium]